MRWNLPIQFEPVISDEKWVKFKKLSGLPDEARLYIDELINIYRQHRPDEVEGPSLGVVRAQILATEKHLEKFIIKLVMLELTEDAVDAIAETCIGNTKKERTKSALKIIAKQLRELNKLGNHLADAANRIPKGKRGPRTQVLQFTFNLLNATLVHYTGKKLIRGTKDHTYGSAAFAAEVLKLADPQIKSPQAAITKTWNLIKNDLIEWDDEFMATLKRKFESRKKKVASL
jgi:hypothetical protein